MRRNALNFVVDGVTFLVMLAMVATGLVMRLVLPPGTGGRGGGVRSTVWGWGRHDWGDLHVWLSVAIGVLLLVHLALHWNWVCCTIARICGRGAAIGQLHWVRSLYGLAGLGGTAALLVGFVWLTAGQAVRMEAGPVHAGGPGPLEQVEGGPGGGHSEQGEEIRGSMTLGEVAALAGVPVDTLRADLKLPQAVSSDERLGRLRRQYGFEISHVREVLRLRQSQTSAE